MFRVRSLYRRFRKTRTCTVLTLLVVLALLCGAEYAFSNRLRLKIGSRTETELALSDATLSGASRLEEGILIRSGSTVIFDGLQTEASVVTLTVHSSEMKMLEIKISTKDDGNKNDYRAYMEERVYTDGMTCFSVRPSGKIRSLRIQCTAGTSATLTSVAFDRKAPVSFSVLRVLLVYILLVGLWSVWRFRLWKLLYDPHRLAHKMLLSLSLFLCWVFVVCLCASAGLQSLPYESEKPNAYEQIFASLLEGRVDIDVPLDPSVLEQLEDPYDYTERNTVVSERFGAFWDRAYYQGKFYCYFGIAPVILIMFPIYFLTGAVPNMSLVMLLLMLLCVGSLYGALLQILQYFRLRPPLLLIGLGFPALLFGSLLPVVALCADMYYVAVASGLTFLAATIWLAFAALNSRKPIARRLLFVLSGLSLVATVASRPTVVLYAAVLIPPFLAVLADQNRTRLEKLGDALAFLLPVCIGILPVLWYNYIRFDSFFEFGATYQLTFNNISYNRLTPELFGETLMHYFLQMPRLSGLFPYFNPSYVALNTYGSFFYSTASVGALAFPLSWVGFAQGFTVGKSRKQPVKKAMYLLLVLLPFVVAFCDLCLGGVNIRYMADILLPLMLVGLLVLLELATRLGNTDDRTAFRFFLLCFALLFATLLLGFAFLFSNERNWMGASAFRFFASVFS